MRVYVSADTLAASMVSSSASSSSRSVVSAAAAAAPLFFHPAFGHPGSTAATGGTTVLGPAAGTEVLGPAALPTLMDGLGAIRQIIAGYRDSAAFLCHSADELELLLAQQHTAVN